MVSFLWAVLEVGISSFSSESGVDSLGVGGDKSRESSHPISISKPVDFLSLS